MGCSLFKLRSNPGEARNRKGAFTANWPRRCLAHWASEKKTSSSCWSIQNSRIGRLALENGLSEEELIEAMTHLAFYTGWPRAASAILVAKGILEETNK